MNAKVYCFVSAKGGSGKTSLAANIGTFVMAIGRKCLLVDCDPATHGMTLLYLGEVAHRANSDTKGLFDFEGSENFADMLPKCIVELESGAHLLPASYRSEIARDPVPHNADTLASVVEVARRSYDVVILDAQAGTDTFARLAMSRSVSDEVVIVSEFDPLSAAGVEMMKRSIGDDLGYTRTWILLNKILPEFVREFAEFMSIAKYLPPVPWDIDVVRAYAKRKLAVDLNDMNDFTLALIQTSRRLLESVCREEIETWLEERAYASRAPLLKQLEKAKAELEHWKETELQSERKRKLQLAVWTSTASYVAFIPVVWFTIRSDVFLDWAQLFFVVMAGVAALVGGATFLLWQRLNNRQKSKDNYLQGRIRELEDRVVRLDSLTEADDEIVIREARAIEKGKLSTTGQ